VCLGGRGVAGGGGGSHFKLRRTCVCVLCVLLCV